MISSFELRGHHLELRSPGALGGGDVPARALPEVDGHGDAHVGQARGGEVQAAAELRREAVRPSPPQPAPFWRYYRREKARFRHLH